jgi:hypothetical protein
MRSTSRFDLSSPPQHSFASPEEKPNVNSPGNWQQGHLSRFEDAMNTGDAEVISKSIDELDEPDMLIHMPLPIQATGGASA